MKDNIGKWLAIILLVITTVVATCFILYNQTDWFKIFIKWCSWAYDGLRRWHWDTFTYP